MRKTILLASVAFLALASRADAVNGGPGAGQNNASVCQIDPSVQRLLNAYKRDQDAGALKKGVASLVHKHPGLASGVVCAANALPADAPGTLAEQTAIADGLAAAWANLAAKDPEQAAVIKTAIGNATSFIQTAFNDEAGKLTGSASVNGVGVSGGVGATATAYAAPSANNGGSTGISPH